MEERLEIMQIDWIKESKDYYGKTGGLVFLNEMEIFLQICRFLRPDERHEILRVIWRFSNESSKLSFSLAASLGNYQECPKTAGLFVSSELSFVMEFSLILKTKQIPFAVVRTNSSCSYEAYFYYA